MAAAAIRGGGFRWHDDRAGNDGMSRAEWRPSAFALPAGKVDRCHYSRAIADLVVLKGGSQRPHSLGGPISGGRKSGDG